jgi:DNA modification methylase
MLNDKIKLMEVNKIYNENCLYTMARMEDNFIDLTITSPPYDNLRTYNGYSFDFESIAKELYRVTKKGGVVIWVVGDATIKGSESGTSFKQALYFMECGFNLHDTMIYHKNALPKNHNRYEQDFEYMFVFSKGKPSTFTPIRVPCVYAGSTPKGTFRHDGDNLGKAHKNNIVKEDKIKGNIWRFPNGYMQGTKDKIATKHSATFPEQLAFDHIISWSNEGDIVYDPFMGSGTTAKMSKLNNRNYIGSEISEEYCKIANERLA